MIAQTRIVPIVLMSVGVVSVAVVLLKLNVASTKLSQLEARLALPDADTRSTSIARLDKLEAELADSRRTLSELNDEVYKGLQNIQNTTPATLHVNDATKVPRIHGDTQDATAASAAGAEMSAPRRVYIDLGVNIKQANSVQEFYNAVGVEQWASWEVHGFEPNPLFADELVKHSRKLGYNFHAAAASATDGNLTFYYDKQGHPQSGSLQKEGRDAVAPDKTVVPAVDFGKFLLRTVRPEDFVVVKMDIEGAEYGVARQLVLSEAFCLIDWFCFESHGAPFDSKPKELSLKTVCEFDRILEYFGQACPSKMCFFTSLFHKVRMAQKENSWFNLLRAKSGSTNLNVQCPDFERREYAKCK